MKYLNKYIKTFFIISFLQFIYFFLIISFHDLNWINNIVQFLLSLLYNISLTYKIILYSIIVPTLILFIIYILIFNIHFKLHTKNKLIYLIFLLVFFTIQLLWYLWSSSYFFLYILYIILTITYSFMFWIIIKNWKLTYLLEKDNIFNVDNVIKSKEL